METTDYGLRIARTLDDVCSPSDMAILVYNMQVGIVGQVRNGPSVVARVRELLDIAREHRMRVVFTRHLSLSRDWMGAFQYRMAMSWQRAERAEQVQPWFVRDSSAFQIVPDLTPLPSEAVFDKITMSAFEGTVGDRASGLRRSRIGDRRHRARDRDRADRPTRSGSRHHSGRGP